MSSSALVSAHGPSVTSKLTPQQALRAIDDATLQVASAYAAYHSCEGLLDNTARIASFRKEYQGTLEAVARDLSGAKSHEYAGIWTGFQRAVTPLIEAFSREVKANADELTKELDVIFKKQGIPSSFLERFAVDIAAIKQAVDQGALEARHTLEITSLDEGRYNLKVSSIQVTERTSPVVLLEVLCRDFAANIKRSIALLQGDLMVAAVSKIKEGGRATTDSAFPDSVDTPWFGDYPGATRTPTYPAQSFMRVFAQATNKSSYFADGTSGAAEGMDAAFHSFYHKFTHIRPEYGRMIFLHNCDAIDLGGRAVRVGSIEGLVRLLPYTSGMQQQAVFCGIGHFGTDTGPVEIVDSLKGAPLSVRRADSPIEEHLIRRALAANQVENALLLMVRSKKEDPDAVEGACVALASFYEQLSVVDHILSAFGEFGETEQDGKIFKRYLSNLALLYGYRGPFARNSPQFSQNPSKPGFPTGEPDGVRPPGIWGEIDDRLGAYVERHRGDEAKSFSLSYVIQCRRTLRDVSIQNYEFEDRQLGQAVEPK